MANSIEFRKSISPGSISVNLRSEVNGQASHLTEEQRRNVGLAFERAAARATGSGGVESDRTQGYEIFNTGMNDYVFFYQRQYHKAGEEDVSARRRVNDRHRRTVETRREGEEIAGRMRIERGVHGLEAVLYDAAILDEAVA